MATVHDGRARTAAFDRSKKKDSKDRGLASAFVVEVGPTTWCCQHGRARLSELLDDGQTFELPCCRPTPE